jgi:hypothetical protein
VRHPLWTLLVALAAVAALGPGLLRLELRADGHALVPAHDPAVRADRAVRERFDARDLIVVVVRSAHGGSVYGAAVLRALDELTREIVAIPGLGPGHVTSLATEPSDRFRPGSLEFRRFLEPPPESPEDLARLRDDLAALSIHLGTLVARDGRSAAIHVGVPPGADRTALQAEIRRRASAAAGGAIEVDVIGAPVAEALLGAHLLQDLGIPRAMLDLPAAGASGRRIGLVPIALVLMSAIFLAVFGRTAAVLIPLLEVAACLTATFGLMGWTGTPVSLTTAILPVILTMIGVSDEIHVLGDFARRARDMRGASAAALAAATMRRMWRPVTTTSLTTAAGFLTFAASPIAPVRAFGIFAAVGVAFAMAWTLIVTPALLVLLGPRRFASRGSRSPWPDRVAIALVATAVRRPRLVVAAAGLLALAAPLGIARLRVQDSWTGGFARHSEFRRATERFDAEFLGVHVLLLEIAGDCLAWNALVPPEDVGHHTVVLPAGAIDDPGRLVGGWVRLSAANATLPAAVDRAAPGAWTSWIESVERRSDGRIAVTMPLTAGSPVVALRQAAPEAGGAAPVRVEISVEPFVIPSALARVRDFGAAIGACAGVGGTLGPVEYLETAHFIVGKRDPAARSIPATPDEVRNLWSNYARIRGPARLAQVLDETRSRGLVSVFVKDASYRDVAALMAAVRAHERAHLAPAGLRVTFAGDLAVSQALIDAVVSTQVRSLLLSLAQIVALAAILSRSLRHGLLCVVPCALAVLLDFAGMGWSGMPLGVATSMFASMVLGIGVDYAIHLLGGYRAARAAGAGAAAAIRASAEVCGGAIVADAGSVALGFGVLTISAVPANARLGLIALLSVLACLAATLLVLPALLALPRRGSEPRDPAEEASEPT